MRKLRNLTMIAYGFAGTNVFLSLYEHDVSEAAAWTFVIYSLYTVYKLTKKIIKDDNA